MVAGSPATGLFDENTQLVALDTVAVSVADPPDFSNEVGDDENAVITGFGAFVAPAGTAVATTAKPHAARAAKYFPHLI
jgi:hypothetical protein